MEYASTEYAVLLARADSQRRAWHGTVTGLGRPGHISSRGPIPPHANPWPCVWNGNDMANGKRRPSKAVLCREPLALLTYFSSFRRELCTYGSVSMASRNVAHTGRSGTERRPWACWVWRREKGGFHKTVKRRRSPSLRLSSVWSVTTLPKVHAYSDSASQDASLLASHVPWRGRVGGALISGRG